MMKILMMKRVGIYRLKRQFILGLEKVHNKKRREAWKQSWRGVVWEDMKFWYIRRKIASVVFCYFESSLPII